MINRGIYGIMFRSADDIYVGKSKHMSRRWGQHLYHLRRGSHTSDKLQASFYEYGESQIRFKVLERIPFGDLDEAEARHCQAHSHHLLNDITLKHRPVTPRKPWNLKKRLFQFLVYLMFLLLILKVALFLIQWYN